MWRLTGRVTRDVEMRGCGNEIESEIFFREGSWGLREGCVLTPDKDVTSHQFKGLQVTLNMHVRAHCKFTFNLEDSEFDHLFFLL